MDNPHQIHSTRGWEVEEKDTLEAIPNRESPHPAQLFRLKHASGAHLRLGAQHPQRSLHRGEKPVSNLHAAVIRIANPKRNQVSFR